MGTYISIDLDVLEEYGILKTVRNKIITQKDTVTMLTLKRNAKHYGKKYIQKWAEEFGGLNGSIVSVKVFCGKTVVFDFVKIFYKDGGVSRWIKQSVLC